MVCRSEKSGSLRQSINRQPELFHFTVPFVTYNYMLYAERGAAFSFILSFFFNFVRIFARVDYFVDLLAVLFPRNSDFVHILFWRNSSVFIPVFSVN